jgi:hypothetical protein
MGLSDEMPTLDKKAFLEWQYNTLRKEIETSRAHHFTIAAGTLVVVPAVELLVGAGKDLVVENNGMGSILAVLSLVVVVLLPTIVLSVYALFFAEHFAIMRCGRYIRNHIEPEVSPQIVGWENWLGKTHLEDKDALKGKRAHEGLQMLAFNLLYGALYLVAVFSAGFACYRAVVAAGWPASARVGVLAVVGIFYILLAAFVLWRVRGAVNRDRHALRLDEEVHQHFPPDVFPASKGELISYVVKKKDVPQHLVEHLHGLRENDKFSNANELAQALATRTKVEEQQEG